MIKRPARVVPTSRFRYNAIAGGTRLRACKSFSNKELRLSGKDRIIPFDAFDLGHVLGKYREAIRKFNPQRFEDATVDAVVHEDTERNICVGYKDVTDREFWVRGHMPGMPLMPGVIMCEVAAQLASYYVHHHGTLGNNEMLGFGGLEGVRFRDTVRPGERLVVMVQ